MLKTNPFRTVILTFAATLLLSGYAMAESPKRIDVPAGDLATALALLAKQSGVELMYSTEQLRGLHTEGVSGEYTTQVAAAKLLEGTNLKLKVHESGGLLISDANEPESAPAAVAAAHMRPVLRVAQSAEQKPVESKTGERIEEIIVTAQKREQRLQDVPSSVSVLTGAKLEALGMTQLSDYAKITPGLVLIASGGPGQGQPTLRGISSGGDRNALVGLYLDDVPFTTNSPRFQAVNVSFDPGLADIERIEVLKGPQSTLYGASTMGGLLKFVSKKPNLTNFEGSVLANGSQMDGYRSGYSVRLSANVPLVTDRVAARGAIFYRKDPGFVDNLFLGQNDANSDTVKGARISILANLGENLENTFSGFTQETVYDGTFNVFLNRTTLQPSLGSLANTSPVDERREFNYDLLANTTVFRMPFATLTNIASYAKFSARDRNEASNTIPTALAATTVPYAVNNTLRESRRYSDEVRLASQPARLEWTLGLFYTDEKIEFPQNINGIDINGRLISPASPPVAPDSVLNLSNIDTFLTEGTYKEKAVFGNLTYHLTDRLEATVGARYSANEQTFFTDANGRIRNFRVSHPADDSATNYLATVSYRPTEALTLYVRAASAYRPGGPNSLSAAGEALALASGAGLDFKSDSLWNYEAGVKGSAWNGAFTYSAAAYHMDWTDIQVNVTYQVPAPGGVGFSTLGATGNADKAKSDGVEVTFNAMPLDGLTLGVSGAYNEATVTSATPLLTANKGDSLPYTPKWTASTLVDYRTAVSSAVTANAGLTYSFVDEMLNGFQRQNPIELPSYGMLDLRAGLEWSRYTLTARVDNATDRYAVTFASINASPYRGNTVAGPISNPLTGSVLRPRTYGLSLEMRF